MHADSLDHHPLPRTRRRVHIRPAELEDLDLCLKLDGSYTTQTVWQMYLDRKVGVEGVGVRFDSVRLPRPMQVHYPRTSDELLGNWQQQDAFLVATLNAHNEGEPEQILGYIDIHLQRWQKTGWVQNLIITPDMRRRGIGGALVSGAAEWGKQEGLARLILECPTKNTGAIQFYNKRGAEFCGFNERYYTNGDVAVFFEYRIL